MLSQLVFIVHLFMLVVFPGGRILTRNFFLFYKTKQLMVTLNKRQDVHEKNLSADVSEETHTHKTQGASVSALFSLRSPSLVLTKRIVASWDENYVGGVEGFY